MFRKLVISGTSKAFQRVASRNTAPVFRRAFSSNLVEKERGDEARYFAQQDALKKAELRAKLEKILELEDSNETKQDVLELLSKPEDQEKSIISKLGLDDWKFALPIGLAVGIPFLANEVVVLSGETQVLAVFILTLSTVYTQAGGLIGKTLDDYSQDIATKLKKVDENILSEVHSTIKANEQLLDLEADVKSVHSVIDDLSIAQADILNYAEEHKFRDAIVKKLDTLVSLEESVNASIRTRIVSSVKADVVAAFTNDGKTKDIALDQAIAALLAGSSGKLGKDVVGEVFVSSLKSYREAYAKNPGSDDILVQLQKDVDAVAVAPVVDGTGGNVYVTYPLSL